MFGDEIQPKLPYCPQVRRLMAGYPLKAMSRANGIGNKGSRRGRTYREVIISSKRGSA